MLRNKLSSMGYRVMDPSEPSDFSIDVNIKAAKPGSAATRLWIGFGAGRAVLLFDALFLDLDGNRIASFEGGRSHTGMEFRESFAGPLNACPIELRGEACLLSTAGVIV